MEIMPPNYEGGTLTGELYARVNGEYIKVSDCPEPITLTEADEVMKTFDYERVRHGRWIDEDPNTPDASYRKNGMSYYCSVCGHRAGKYKHKTYRYCPWCGARMVET